MTFVSDLIKTAFVPGSTSFLIAALALGLALLYTRAAAWGRRLLLVVLLGYVALSLPAVSRWLQTGARATYPPIRSSADAQGATTLVLLGNGIVTYTDGRSVVPTLTRRTAYNVMEAARLHTLLHPLLFIVSGGIVVPGSQLRSEAEAMADQLERLGVPRAGMTLDTRSVNTYEQSEWVRAHTRPGARVIVITTPIHMPRTLALFESRGLRPIAAPSAIDYLPGHTARWTLLVPSPSALRASELVMYEYLAEVNGWARGWLTRNDLPQ